MHINIHSPLDIYISICIRIKPMITHVYLNLHQYQANNTASIFECVKPITPHVYLNLDQLLSQ